MPSMPGLYKLLGPLILEAGVPEVARRSGVSQPSIYRFLRDEQNFPEDKLRAVAQAVGRHLVVSPASMTADQVHRPCDELTPAIRRIGLSEVSRRSGVSIPTLYSFMRGDQGVTEQKLHAIAEACGRSIVVCEDATCNA